jgi:hypothetical protein
LRSVDNPAVFPCTIESEYYSLQHSIDNIPRPCVVIFTARDVERTAVLEHIKSKSVELPSQIKFLTQVRKARVVAISPFFLVAWINWGISLTGR